MSEDEYFTTDTQSVPSEIDVSEVKRTDDETPAPRALQWKRPIAYLIGSILVALLAVSVGYWLLEGALIIP